MAFPRGEKLIKGEGAPTGARVLQFYPSRMAPRSAASGRPIPWRPSSGTSTRRWETRAQNTCYEVDAEKAFAERPLGLPESAAVSA